ncbi:hypothetical protein [Saccharothrix algeriensis]|uniref:Uncharacterized protein YraI n=1 Tax=Saccharothrix algeriensis TaxID=173560 RepID=A0A8T8HXN5_9PSEU|nr:hypothetical protein [Saccharothrix algeriensis]MBM7814987.1 uncharacterized protein YraI [Saccharothrix algeriensis]QTR03248.1 hypothetical protein J7S33_30605 [Saccharothrix algeriensis]
MKFASIAAGAALAAAGVLGASGTAVAAPNAPYYVTTWHDVNVRSCEATSCPVIGWLPAGSTSIAYCWTYGEPITDAGITNDVWLVLSRQDGGRRLASAVYFQGDERANLPYEANCDR